MNKILVFILSVAFYCPAQIVQQIISTGGVTVSSPPAAIQSTGNCNFFGTSATTVTIGGSSATTCPTATGWTSNVSGGNTLVGFIWRKTGSGTLSTVTDGGDTCTVVNAAGTAGTSNAMLMYGFYCVNITGNVKPTITATFTVSENFWYATATELSNIVASSPLDGAGTGGAGAVFVGMGATALGTNAATTGNWTTATNGDFVYCGQIDDSGGGITVTDGTISQSWSAVFPLDNTHTEAMITEGGVQTLASASTICAFTTSAGSAPLIGGMAFKHR